MLLHDLIENYVLFPSLRYDVQSANMPEAISPENTLIMPSKTSASLQIPCSWAFLLKEVLCR